MKRFNKICLYACVLLSFGTSCKKDFLTEVPLAFTTVDNSYISLSDFNNAVYQQYKYVRSEFYSAGGGGDETLPFDYQYGLDLVYDGAPGSIIRFGNYTLVIPVSTYLTAHWANFYKIIANSNTILARLKGSAVPVANQTTIQAQAMFFRAFAYRSLAELYGGVPLVLNEVTTPKIDYVRASQHEVYQQAITDLVFAAANLPSITTAQNGEISNLAADHLLAEVYLADGQFNNSVTAATLVIGDPNMALMQNRFGSQVAEAGDVYYDLFRPKNQNRASGNKEGIWVAQFENDVLGGGSSSTSWTGVYLAERQFAPYIGGFIQNAINPFLYPVSDFTGGRGVGYGISMRYYTDSIWASDFSNDMRNSKYNFVRTFTYNDPAKPTYFGKTISTNSPPTGMIVPQRAFYAYQTKVTTPGHHPTGLYANIATQLLSNSYGVAGGTYTDQYIFRLAETYLIRAEAYLGAGNTANAALDINVVRARANASPVLPGAVNIDYILDERMRELGIEEKRRLTLGRLGMVYSRAIKAKNPLVIGISPTNNLWPIPQTEIDRNTGAKLVQNPGY